MLFLTDTMLSDYAGDNNLSIIEKDFNKIKDSLAKDFGIVTNWFYENLMVIKFLKMSFYVYWQRRRRLNIYF